MSNVKTLQNFFDGQWHPVESAETLEVINPATREVLGKVPLTPGSQVDRVVQSAVQAFSGWRAVPTGDKIQHLFKLKSLLEDNLTELSRLITQENGKTIGESQGEMRRAIENVEVACGVPTMMMGDFSEDIAPGIDEFMIRQPVGVCAIISPFNFPGMIPFWFMPYALACGNTVVLKPSERTPMTMQVIVELIQAAGFPKGVVNLVNGAADTVNALLDHHEVRAISFVGSTPVARHIYARASVNGKRVQVQAGAKNATVILADADINNTISIVTDSAFGNAGQRCLATSLVITVGEARKVFSDALAEAARERKVGYGLDEGVEMGPVITPQSKKRIEGLIEKGVQEGASILVEGRDAIIPGYERGNFLRPCILEGIKPGGTVFQTEIFGPVLGLLHVATLNEAIEIINSHSFGNMACLFTSNGSAARKFRSEVQAGNIGINIGVAAPMAFFPFSGWKESFFGTLHGQGKHAVEFFTQTKVVVERWLKDWSRKF